VAVGLVYAAELAHRLGRIGPARVAEHRAVVAGYGLASTLPAGTDDDELVRVMTRDKKATRGLTFVLDGPAGLEVVAGVTPSVARDALDDIRP
jgi:5-deoxy-5-amino-3-dehydroquinate synthase